MAIPFKKSKLNDCKGDLTKQWYVYYSYWNPDRGDNGEYERFRKFISLRKKTKMARYSRAKELIKELNEQLELGWSPLEEDLRIISYSEALEDAKIIKSAQTGKRTAHTYSSMINIFIAFLDDKENIITITQVNRKIAQRFMDYSLIEKRLAVRTYNNRLTALKALFNLLINRNYIKVNPFVGITKLPLPDSPITAFSRDEEILIDTVLFHYDRRLYIISLFVYYCYLRPADIMRLKFENIFLDEQVLITYGTQTKNKKQRVITIPDAMISDLKRAGFDTNFPKNRIVFSRGLEPGDKELAPTRIAERWLKFKKHSGLTKDIYQLKHTGNGRAREAGIDVVDIQRQNRHSSLAHTQIYLDKVSKIPSKNFKSTFPKLGSFIKKNK